MEMGTGKTRTMLEIINYKAERNKIEHILWLCPCSCKINLRRDIEKHADINTNDLTICGIETLSSSTKTTYDLYNLVTSKKCILIVDESNLIKNHNAIRSKRIFTLAENCKYRFILNGTPITKNIADLFSQWYLLDWRILGYKSYYSFSANHLEFDETFQNKVRNVLNIDYLTDKINLYTYQVRKDECLNLPEKIYSKRYFSLDYDQILHYSDIAIRFLSLVDNAEIYNVSTMIYRTITALQEVTAGQKITSSPNCQMEHSSMFENPFDNPRIQCLIDTVKLLGDEKIIIWCKFTHEISDIMYVLKKTGYKCVSYFGLLSQSKRQKSIEEFEKESQIFVANKSCAGYGLNLQHCHNAIYYDNDYDWGTRMQSEDRLHRIGQNSTVNIVDIVADATIDGRIQEALARKENICDELKRNIAEKKDILKWLGVKKKEGLTV